METTKFGRKSFLGILAGSGLGLLGSKTAKKPLDPVAKDKNAQAFRAKRAPGSVEASERTY